MMNKMNKYAVSLIRPMTVTMEVEASTESEAVTKALNCVIASEEVLPWNTHSVQATGTQLIFHADRDAAKLEAMLNVLREEGFEIAPMNDYRHQHTGYEIHGKTPELELGMCHEIECRRYAEGLTPDNFLCAWKENVTHFDPAWETVEAIEYLNTEDAAKCLRDMLEDCDAYAYHLRAVTAKMQKAMLEFDKKEDA